MAQGTAVSMGELRELFRADGWELSILKVQSDGAVERVPGVKLDFNVETRHWLVGFYTGTDTGIATYKRAMSKIDKFLKEHGYSCRISEVAEDPAEWFVEVLSTKSPTAVAISQ